MYCLYLLARTRRPTDRAQHEGIVPASGRKREDCTAERAASVSSRDRDFTHYFALRRRIVNQRPEESVGGSRRGVGREGCSDAVQSCDLVAVDAESEAEPAQTATEKVRRLACTARSDVPPYVRRKLRCQSLYWKYTEAGYVDMYPHVHHPAHARIFFALLAPSNFLFSVCVAKPI